MKRVDATYTVNTERQFQARNSSGFEIELSMPATLAATLPRIETLFRTGLVVARPPLLECRTTLWMMHFAPSCQRN
jgi:sporulation-control protein spo0M